MFGACACVIHATLGTCVAGWSISSKFDKYRQTTNDIDFGSHWKEARINSRTRGNREINKRMLVIIAILVLFFLWIIDFDLSIFTIPR